MKTDLNPKTLTITDKDIDSKGNVVVVLNDSTIYIPQDDLVDKAKVLEELTKEKARLEQELARSNKMLSNPNFVSKAPAAKLEAEKEKLAQYEAQYAEVLAHLKDVE